MPFGLLYVGKPNPNQYSGLQTHLSIAQRRGMGGGREQKLGKCFTEGIFQLGEERKKGVWESTNN